MGIGKLRHLYIVLDDWSWGYSIRQIDLFSGDPDQQLTRQVHSLPSALFLFEAPRGYPRYFAGAYDSKILAMPPRGSNLGNICRDGTLIYDVHMRSVIAGPRQSPDPIDPIYIPVGEDRLFALAAGSFQMLYLPPLYEFSSEDREWTWRTLPKPPFLHKHVTCYAVHSDGRIYVTIGGGAPATFSFDTAYSVKGWWKKHPQCNMPFKGRAYFVPELNAWVGLCESGLIGAIDVASEIVDGSQPDLALKMFKEEFSCLFTDELARGTTLISLGGGTNFCLLQYIYKNKDELTDSSTSKENKEQQDCKPLMQLITFYFTCDNNGGLTIRKSSQIQHYSVPSQVTLAMLNTPVAFWM